MAAIFALIRNTLRNMAGGYLAVHALFELHLNLQEKEQTVTHE